jgi:hypothetical protein
VAPATGSIPSGGVTNDATPTFNGSAEADATLRVRVNGGTPTTILVSPSGTWAYTPTLADGSYLFSFVAIDAAGNESAAATYSLTIDTLIRATVSGLGQWPNDPPDFGSAVSSLQVQFNTAVTGFTAMSVTLQRLVDPADASSGQAISLAGALITGSGVSWTITLPSSDNPTALKGRYKLVIGGIGSGIQAGVATMDVPAEWYFDRI